MRLLLAILFLFFSLCASAQKVVDAQSGEPIAGAVVQLLDAKFTPITYTITDGEGCFKPFTKSGDYLKFSCMNYRADTIAIGNVTDTIKLISEPQIIREITVTAPKIRMRGDTLSYNVASFADNTDRTIGDVLGKMPGVEVEGSGQIKYNGKDINKFYIEGADMMDSRYGIATGTISFEDVAAVEVMENHQPIKSLEDVSFSDKAAINLKLKESAKAKWSAIIEAGGGLPEDYLGEVTAMSFARKFQTINTIKTNNTGKDVTSETSATSIMEMIARDENGGEISDYISISPYKVGSVDTHLGNSEAASINFLHKLSEDSDLKGNITLSNSNFNYENERSTTYFLEDSTINLQENENSTQHLRTASANFTLTTNAKEFYLRNTLKADASSERIGVHTLGTYPNSQLGDITSGEVSNNFELVKRIGDNTLNISSYNGCSTKPQELTVVDALSQNIEASAFSSNTKVTYSFRSGNWNIFTGGGVNYYTQNINDYNFEYFKAYLNLQAEYRSRKGFILTLSAPMSYYIGKKSFTAQFSAYAKVPLSARWSLTTNAGIQQSPISNSYFYEGAIYNDYRTISYGVTDFAVQKAIYGSFGFTYKDPLTLLFVNGDVGYSRSVNPYISSQTFEDEYIINRFVQGESYSSSISSNLNIGKGYSGGRVSLGLSYIIADGESLQNGSKLNYTLDQASVNLKANKKITGWLSGEYAGGFQISSLDKFANNSWLLNQSASLVFTPVKSLNITTSGSYLLTENSNLLLLGASARWQINKQWELSLEATNLLDESHYLVESLSGTEFTSTKYLIRPRQILATIRVSF